MTVIPKPKDFSWSYSNVQNYETCARKFYHQNVVKDVSDVTTNRTSGSQIHEFMNLAIKGIPLPPHLQHWQRWVDELEDMPGKLLAEQKMAYTEQLEPCDFFDKRVKPWCRIVVDALVLDGDHATMWDWKSGKFRPDPEQLMVYAACIFINYRAVKTIDAALIFLKNDLGPHIPRTDCMYELQISRDAGRRFFKRYLQRVFELKKSFETDNWPPTPSGLCRAHCNVVTCEHNGRYEG